MRTRALFVLTAGLLVAGLLQADEPKADLEALRGSWLVVSQQREGRPTERPKGMKWVIDGDTIWLVIERAADGAAPEAKKPAGKGAAPGRGLRMTCRLEPGKSPRQIDFDGPKKGTSYGIYKLAGDELTVCMGVNCPSPKFDPQAKTGDDAARTRPTTFSPEAGTVIVLKRVKE